MKYLTATLFQPQSNGHSERFVDTFKRAAKKIREGEDQYSKRADVPSTPNRTLPDQKSSSEVMFEGKIHTCLMLTSVRTPIPPSNDCKKSRHAVGCVACPKRLCIATYLSASFQSLIYPANFLGGMCMVYTTIGCTDMWQLL